MIEALRDKVTEEADRLAVLINEGGPRMSETVRQSILDVIDNLRQAVEDSTPNAHGG